VSSAAQLERAIEELPERQRQVILLVGLEGMSYEPGRRYGCSRVAG
jgi:DNA-directed RNA polymerase specialized sigma24 family protein